MKKLLILLSVILLMGVISWWRSPKTVQGPFSEVEFEYITRISGSGESSDRLPLIIALHGHGDTPDNFYATLLKHFNYPARFIVMRGPIEYPGVGLHGRAWPTDIEGLRKYGGALADAVSALKEDFPAARKPIIIGFSGGASVAYYLAAFHGNTFSYIFPLSGRMPNVYGTTEMTSLDKEAKVIAFHGTHDQVIGFQHGKAAVQRLKQRGMDAELMIFNGGHLGVFRSANTLFLNRLRDAAREISP